jgi:TRAP-type mannitol/chloroaromatic compound transport system substrate-binding protein
MICEAALTQQAKVSIAASIEYGTRVSWRVTRGLKGKVMSKFAVIIVAVLSTCSIAVAEEKMVVDMNKLTCGELTKLGFEDFAGVTMWLSGYYNSSIRNTVVDLYEFARAAKTVKDYCKTNQRATVMSAAERALGIKMPR